jgi:cob(I)alamin adenosyltransferase
MKIYTRTGDDGSTSLAGGERIMKFDIRVEAYGSVDELISWIGLLRDLKENGTRKESLLYIQDQLMRCAATLAHREESNRKDMCLPETSSVSFLESEIDRMDEILPPLKNFILPGGSLAASYSHVARCVCRRAERAVLRLNESEKIDPLVYRFLNRLADYLFTLSRMLMFEHDIEELKWTI